MYAIEYTREAELDLLSFRKRDQQIIVTAIAHQLHFEPLVVTTNRFRRNPPDIASWELRVGLFRVYYEVDEQVRIVTIKRHDQTYWRKTEQRNLLSW